MAWQTLVISNPAKLSIKNNNILLQQIGNEDTKITISEISAIVIENQQVVLSAVFMQLCAMHNIVVIFSDDKYMPIGIYQPFCTHSRTTKNTLRQINWGQVLKNRLWQKIIKAKISNQYQVLYHLNQQKYNTIYAMINKVQSGDKTNREAYVAHLYWRALFASFKRSDEQDMRNIALNYAYSIVRSAIARSISASGFIPAVGIFHKSELNAFNLADDLIEPFRPIIDLMVYRILQTKKFTQFDHDIKIALIKVLNIKVRINQEITTILNATRQSVASLIKVSQHKHSKYLLLPCCV